MLRKTAVVYFVLISVFMVLAASCTVTGDDCGPFPGKFKTIGFDTQFNKIALTRTYDVSVAIQYATLEEDTVRFDKIGISMFPVIEGYASATAPSPTFSLFPKAFACSPPMLTSEEEITDIRIYSDKSFNSEYNPGDNLAELFNIVVFYEADGYHWYRLNDFVTSNLTVPDAMFLLPASAPETTEPLQFTIKYYQDGIDMDYYEFTTNEIVLTK